jgi:DNA-binding NarL/FixJ family response regulator
LVREGAEGLGYLLKDRVGNLDAFADAVERVANGGSALDPQVVRSMVERPRIESPIDSLTPREREVLVLMAEGLSNQGIADNLVVTVAAIERHVTSIFVKLGLRPTSEDHRRVLAVLTYLRDP